MAHTADSTEHHGHGHHHSVPKKTLVTIFVALLALTLITVLTATQLDLGAFNVPLALAIAGTKAYLVVAFFMALKYDSPVNRLVMTTGIIFVAIFMFFTLLDVMFRGDVGNVATETIMDTQRREEELLQSGRQSTPAPSAAPASEQAQPDAAPAGDQGEGGQATPAPAQ